MSAAGGADVVFGRGGIRGIALAGSAAAFDERGLRIDRVGGTSAGALVAALVAAGYRGGEIRQIAWQLDCGALRDPVRLRRMPAVGGILAMLGGMGLYAGDALLETFRTLLAARGVRTFRDLRAGGATSGYRLRVLATDLTRRCAIALPDDAVAYGIDPDDLEVALALRMSASMPFFYEPVRFGAPGRQSLVVDGGLLAGVPFRLLGSAAAGRPVFGVQTGRGPVGAGTRQEIRGPISLLAASFYSALAINDRSVADSAGHPVIDIDCGAVRSVHFAVDDACKARLFEAGRSATHAFLSRWAADRPRVMLGTN